MQNDTANLIHPPINRWLKGQDQWLIDTVRYYESSGMFGTLIAVGLIARTAKDNVSPPEQRRKSGRPTLEALIDRMVNRDHPQLEASDWFDNLPDFVRLVLDPTLEHMIESMCDDLEADLDFLAGNLNQVTQWLLTRDDLECIRYLLGNMWEGSLYEKVSKVDQRATRLLESLLPEVYPRGDKDPMGSWLADAVYDNPRLAESSLHTHGVLEVLHPPHPFEDDENLE